jgi:ubiquinone/menaquinone biosynthesis C-methylase UbiE
MKMDTDLDAWRERMRRDWDARAAVDAEHFIYAKSSCGDTLDFVASGKANYDQLIRPYVPFLLNGHRTRDCDVVEIGCGIGRITEWFAREFRHVYAVDVSPVMLAKARQRLGSYSNITFHAISGSDLAPIPSHSIDLVFSYIVFQHIPSRELIDNLLWESARVLRSGGALKCQLNGDQSPEYATHTRDTWFGETYSIAEVQAILKHSGLTAIAMEGAGTQYLTVTARKGPAPSILSWVLPGEPWSSEYLLEGFGSAVDNSWRPMSARARARVPGTGTRLYVGLYFWPESCRHSVLIAGKQFFVDSPGDHYFECTAAPGEIDLQIDPLPRRPPAFRVIGIY